MTFIFRNRTIFWDISKWNRGQKKWDGGSIKEKKILKLLSILLQNKLQIFDELENILFPKIRVITKKKNTN